MNARDDELIGGDDRSAAPLDLGKGSGWEKKLASLSKGPAPNLALPAFSLIRGGDMFERSAKKTLPRTDKALLERFEKERLDLSAKGIAAAEKDLALPGLLRVLAGNPAICQRLYLARPIRVVIVKKGRDFREHGFPPHTNPNAAGIFWNGKNEATALLGLREEHISVRPWLMAHEMTHAVHLLGLTQDEQALLEKFLMPVYLSRRWSEEAFAVYAERAFGASYEESDLRAPGLYGKIRREWKADHVFAKFVAELLRP